MHFLEVLGLEYNNKEQLNWFNQFLLHDIFIGDVIQAYCEDKHLTNGAPDFTKMKLMTLTSTEKNNLFYWELGEQLGRAFNVGLKYRKRKKDS